MKNIISVRRGLIENNPQLKQDINLFKLILRPLELYVLKLFLINLSPKNIREVYTDAIFISFHQLFAPEKLQTLNNSYRFLVKDVISAGYGFGFVKAEKRKKIIGEIVRESQGLSETKIRQLWLKQIKDHNSKTPSYDKIRAIFKKFEKIGIIYHRGKEGKGIIYGLNPQFYNVFKNKRKNIIEL